MQVELIIQAGWIIPVVPRDTIYKNHSLIIDNGKIIDCLPEQEAAQRYQAENTRFLPEHALIPGFINAHTHTAMSLMRGIADELPLMEWLQQHIWPLEQQWVSADFVRDGAELAIAEMIRGGTTCFNDMYFFPDVVAKQADELGIRAHIGLIVIDFPTIWAQNSDEYIEKALALLQQYQDHPLINTPLAPHAPYTVSDKPLQTIAEISQSSGQQIHMHVHETEAEVFQHQKEHGVTPLQRLEKLGLLSPSMMAVHMTQLTKVEIESLAETGTHIIHCPESNLKLACGFCPVAACLEQGINVALGTDGCASNNDLDMLAEMRSAALLAKGVQNNAAAVPAMTALELATINGAKALGVDRLTGSLEIGKAADVIAIDLSELETQPLYNPVSQIVYAASRHQITDVWVAGKHLLKQRKLTTIDLDSLQSRIRQWQLKLKP